MPDAAEFFSQAQNLVIVPLIGTILIVGEWLYVRFVVRIDGTHDSSETLTSFGIAALDYGVRPLVAGATAVPIFWIYQHRLFEFSSSNVVALIALVLLVDFIDYWFHRASHAVRFLWAVHSVHHSTTTINLSAAIRTSVFAPLVTMIYMILPLVWVGFHPVVTVVLVSAIQLYQFTIHMARVPNWGVFEHFMNTPAHHRVHHATNPHCIDKNFGSILIVWDKLFGTFERVDENEELKFGVVGNTPWRSPIAINLREWRRIFADVASARSWQARLQALVREP